MKSYNATNGYGFVVLSSTGEEALVLRDILPPGTVLTPGENLECRVAATFKGKRVTQVSLMHSVQASAASLVLAASNGVPVAGAAPSSQESMAPSLISTTGDELGTVKSFNAEKGYGFIFTSQGEEALVKRESLMDGETLTTADQVVFQLR